MTKKSLIVCVLSVLFIAGFIGISNQYLYADQKKTVEEYVKLAGDYIKNNPELLSKSIDAVNNKVNYEDVITKVDLLPLSIGEFEFRKGLSKAAGVEDANDKSIFNTLVEEKLIISYAIKNNVLPSKSEIDSFVESEQLLYEKVDKNKKIINDFCVAANMSVEDYWKTYEYYNAYRIVTLNKAYDNAIETGVKKGEVKALESSKNDLNLEEHENYWNRIKKEMKNSISLNINKQYKNKDFILDNTKLYL